MTTSKMPGDEFISGQITFGLPKPSMTPEECVSHGGHCHDDTGESRLSIPPQYQQRCRHCGHVRRAIPQDQYRYIDETGQPL